MRENHPTQSEVLSHMMNPATTISSGVTLTVTG
jgi:hypothetical protein